MPTNWPPPAGSYPAWPDLAASHWSALADELERAGWTLVQPTQAERQAFFPNSVKCGDGHNISGRMLVSPEGARYPFAACNGQDKELLVLWPPYTCGFDSDR